MWLQFAVSPMHAAVNHPPVALEGRASKARSPAASVCPFPGAGLVGRQSSAFYTKRYSGSEINLRSAPGAGEVSAEKPPGRVGFRSRRGRWCGGVLEAE